MTQALHIPQKLWHKTLLWQPWYNPLWLSGLKPQTNQTKTKHNIPIMPQSDIIWPKWSHHLEHDFSQKEVLQDCWTNSKSGFQGFWWPTFTHAHQYCQREVAQSCSPLISSRLTKWQHGPGETINIHHLKKLDSRPWCVDLCLKFSQSAFATEQNIFHSYIIQWNPCRQITHLSRPFFSFFM